MEDTSKNGTVPNGIQRIGDRFALTKKIGSGAFGEIYSATNIQSGEVVAVKLEYRRCKYPQLLYEARLLKLLGLSKRGK